MDPKLEQELVARAKEDDHAFEELYNFYLPRIYGYIYKRVGNQADAEEVTSRTFLKMVSHLRDFDERKTGKTGYFKSWLYCIATNTVIDYYRTRKPVEDLEDHESHPDPTDSPVKQAEQEEHRLAVQETISRLPEKYQQILHLKFFADLSNQEIALSLGITENHAGVMLHRALKEFQKVHPKPSYV